MISYRSLYILVEWSLERYKILKPLSGGKSDDILPEHFNDIKGPLYVSAYANVGLEVQKETKAGKSSLSTSVPSQRRILEWLDDGIWVCDQVERLRLMAKSKGDPPESLQYFFISRRTGKLPTGCGPERNRTSTSPVYGLADMLPVFS